MTYLSKGILFGLCATLAACGGSGGGSGTPCGGEPAIAGYPSDPDHPLNYILRTYELNGRRHYVWDQGIDLMCPKVHVTVDFLAVDNNEANLGLAPGDVVVTSRVYWAVFFEENHTLTRSGSPGGPVTYQDTIADIGLTQAFGDSAGAINVQMDLSFPIQGNESADNFFALGLINHLSMTTRYQTFVHS